MDEKGFQEALKKSQVPILVLDQKWHRLFAISGKPEEVKILEVEENELFALQGKLSTELKELKKIKNQLIQNIVANMDESSSSPQMEEDKRLIDETNAKIIENEDRLMEIPKQIKEKNDELMMATMKFSYDKLRTNMHEINDIAEWIKKIRVELKKNIIKKQNREINNKESYFYMHDVFGKDIINLFDVKFDDNYNEVALDDKANLKETKERHDKKDNN